MKKLISLLAALAVVSTASVAFAADSDTYGTITVPDNLTKLEATDGSYTVNVSTSDQGTILAVQGTAIKVGSIQYINQATATDGKASFTFKLNDDRISSDISDTKVYVLTNGGVVGYIETAQSADPETFTISGTVKCTIGKTLPVVKIVSTTDDSKSYTAVVDNTGAYTITGVPADSYTFTITKASHITYTSPLTISVNKAVDDITLYAGDTNGDNVIDVGDFTAVGNNFGTSSEALGDSFVKSADTNDDAVIDVGDFTAVGNNFGKSATANYTNIK